MTDQYSERFDHGDIVVDREDDDPNEAVVVNAPDETAANWYVQGRGTLADDNPDYPADDPVVIVVFRDDLSEHRPTYAGYRPLPIASLNGEVPWYAFPESRLERVDSLVTTETLPVDQLHASPYHSRTFDEADNREFIATIAERGRPESPPLVRPVDDGYEIINGHKRTWASYVAGVSAIPCLVAELDDDVAAREWARQHLDAYDDEQTERAMNTLRTRFGADAPAIAGRARADGGDTDA